MGTGCTPTEETAMVWFRRVLALGMIAAVALSLAACTRKITRVEVVQQAATCFQCHSDTNTALVAAQQQYQYSKHASGSTLNENDGVCKGCHTSEGFVARVTGQTIPDVVENPTAITCFTCHAPHTNGDLRLRWTAAARLQNGATYDLGGGNLCSACHQSRRNVTTYVAGRVALSNRWGPHHGPQADMLIGSNGYQYSGYTYEQSPHRSVVTDGCLACHKNAPLQLVLGGHSFNMAYDVGGEEVQNVGACTNCHGELNSFADEGPGFSVQDSVSAMIDHLGILLTNAKLLSDGLPTSVTTSADSAGAVWNYLITKEDRSLGVHNAKYIMGLLESSIQYIRPAPPTNRLLAGQGPKGSSARKTR